jgi:hypothetical protein
VAVVPLAGAVVAAAFAVLLLRDFVRRRRPHHLLWAVALAMFAAASALVSAGSASGWSGAELRAYWLLGAVLTVPYLAMGELALLLRRPRVVTPLLLLLLFGTAFAVSRVRTATLVPSALHSDLPSGADAFARDHFALTLARLYSIPAYAVLLAGTVWSAWRMRSRPELRPRFVGVLLIAAGATVVAAGSAFAATGNATGFSLTLTAGVAVMFAGFLRASRT